MDSISDRLDSALKQSEQMLKLAGEGDWEQVEALQKQHSTLINQLVNADFAGCDIAQVRTSIEKIQTLDKETEALASIRKAEIIKEKQQQDKADKMKKAFGEFK